MQFLSPQWRHALRDAASAVTPSMDSSADVLAVGIEVRDGVDIVRWRMVLGPAGISIDEGEPDVTIVVDRLTATQLAQGACNAQRALTEGRLSIRGDARALAAADAALAAIGDVFASVRADTVFS